MPLLHHLSKALRKWTSLESKHLPITALKQFSSMQHYLQKKMHYRKLECHTVMLPLSQVEYPHANTVLPYGIKIGSTDNYKQEDNDGRNQQRNHPGLKASMTKYTEAWKRNLFFQKLHTLKGKRRGKKNSKKTPQQNQEISQWLVAWDKPEQKPRSKITTTPFDTLLTVLDLLIWWNTNTSTSLLY